jgi:hypothetical protein
VYRQVIYIGFISLILQVAWVSVCLVIRLILSLTLSESLQAASNALRDRVVTVTPVIDFSTLQGGHGVAAFLLLKLFGVYIKAIMINILNLHLLFLCQ